MLRQFESFDSFVPICPISGLVVLKLLANAILLSFPSLSTLQ